MRVGDEFVELLGEDPLATGTRSLVGTVTDAGVYPPLIDTGGGAQPTLCVRGYRPFTGDFVQVLTDWNGSYSAARLCVGPIAKAASCILRRVANQSSTGGATTTVSWDTEDVDQGGFITVTSTNITIPAGCDGVYAITTKVNGAGNFAIGSTLTIEAPAGTLYPFERARAAPRLAATATVKLNAGDVITIDVFNNGATQNMTGRCEVAAVA